jgi:hypothetical protein
VWKEPKLKLDGRAEEVVWVGVDEWSKGAQIYWPNKWLVTIEWNIYFDAAMITLRGRNLTILR